MIKAIAIDDEPLALEVIKAFCSKVDFVDLQHTFTNLSTANKYLKENTVDLLFLDIRMPAMSGVNFYRSLQEKLMVIFTTAYAEYAVEGFDLSAIDYLLKPIEFERFQQAVEKAKEYYQYKLEGVKHHYLFIKADYSIHKINTVDILYIESLDNYIKLHLVDGKPILTRMSMKSILEELPQDEFLRVHRSYIVPFSKISAMRNKVLYLDNMEIPVGTNYVDEITKLFH